MSITQDTVCMKAPNPGFPSPPVAFLPIHRLPCTVSYTLPRRHEETITVPVFHATGCMEGDSSSQFLQEAVDFFPALNVSATRLCPIQDTFMLSF